MTLLADGATVTVLVNPAARRTLPARSQLWLERLLSQRFVVKFLAPLTADEMVRAARTAISHSGALALAGGDGTINAVLNAVDPIDLTLAILPLGTANDLARELHIPLDLEGAARRILTGGVRRVDILEVNEQRFCTVGGLGLVADCALTVGRIRASSNLGHAAVRWLGPVVYRVSAIANILLRPGILYPIRVSYCSPSTNRDVVAELMSHGLFVANQPRIAAGLTVHPSSSNSDGVFEICLLPAGPRVRLLGTLVRMAIGAHLPASSLQVLPATRALIGCRRATTFLGDGEFLCRADAHRIIVKPQALRIIC